jgi:hypothetical protein
MPAPESVDGQWRSLVQEGVDHARKGNWGLYTNTVMGKGQLLLKVGHRTDALLQFLEVCYLDLNGPENGGPRPWRPSEGLLAPLVVQWVVELAAEEGLSDEALKTQFLTISKGVQSRLKTPVDPEKGWMKLQATIQGIRKSHMDQEAEKELRRQARAEKRMRAKEAKTSPSDPQLPSSAD